MRCANCKKELKENMEIEYSKYQTCYFCSFKCAEDYAFEFMEIAPIMKPYSKEFKKVLCNSSPPVRTSKSKILTSEEPKGFNMGDKVSASPTPKLKSEISTSHHPNIKLNSGGCLQHR